MEFLQLKYFCDAAVTQNLSKTAKKYYVPTSTVSISIKKLEDELGCKLFHHSSNKIMLNDEGREFYENISKALAIVKDAKDKIRDTGAIRGTISIRCRSNRGALTRAMEEFLRDYPEVRFKIIFGEASANNIDITMSYDGAIEYDEKILLIDEDLPIAINVNNPLAHKEDLTIADLKHERFIVGLSITTAEACYSAGFSPNIAFEFNDPTYVRKYLELGLGIAFVPSYSWADQFSDNLVLRSLGVRRKTYAYLPKDKYTKRSVRLFLDYLKKATEDAR